MTSKLDPLQPVSEGRVQGEPCCDFGIDSLFIEA